MVRPKPHGGTDDGDRLRALARVRRNFWVLLAATVVAVGILTTAAQQPARPATAGLIAVSSLAALVTVSLAARILIVVTHRGRSDDQGSRRH